MDKEQYIILSILFIMLYFPGTFAIGYAIGMRANRHDQTKNRFEEQREVKSLGQIELDKRSTPYCDT